LPVNFYHFTSKKKKMQVSQTIGTAAQLAARRILIIGGVAAGATAATRCRRENEYARIKIFEKGPYISFSNCGLPFYLGGIVKQRSKLLVTTPEDLLKKYNVEAKPEHEVLKIDRQEKRILVKNLKKLEEFWEPYDKLILATGAAAIIPPLPGVQSMNVFVVKTVPDTDKIKDFMESKKPQSILIVGGGFIGLECAEAFKMRGLNVTIVEMLPHILPPFDNDMASIVHHHLEHSGIRIITNQSVKSLETNGDPNETLATAAVLSNGEKVLFDLCIMCVGVRGEISLAKESGLTIGEAGGIVTDEFMRTSDQNIYAAGDATEVQSLITKKNVRLALAGIANKQGRVAGTNAANTDTERFHGALGTCIVESMGISAAMTGLTERTCKLNNIEYNVGIVHPSDHTTVYPGASTLHIKLLTEKSTNKLMGCQVVGEHGVDKRCDVIATAIYGNMTANDLANLDLCYAPQFDAAKGPVHVAGSLLANVFQHKVNLMSFEDLEKRLHEGSQEVQVVDVREKHEYQNGHIAHTINIPLSSLRQTLDQLDPSKETFLMCHSGLRSYVAARILAQHGFGTVYSVSGGVLSVPLHEIVLD